MIQDQWIPFQQVEWDNPQFSFFNIDTTDFYVKASLLNLHIDNDYYCKEHLADFYNIEELKSIIEEFYIESKKGFLSSCKPDNWELRYIKIYKTQYGFFICNNNNKLITKDILFNAYEKL